MAGQKPKMSTIFGPNPNTFSPAVPQLGGKSKTIGLMSISDYCRTR